MNRILPGRLVGAVIALCLTIGPAVGHSQSTSAAAQFKAAQNKEQIQGDLKGAIEDYRKIAEGPDKVWAPRAWLQIAECYRKLGDAEAATIYQQLTTSADANTAAEARRQLAALRGTGKVNIPAPNRIVWTQPADVQGAKVAPDGQSIAYVTTGNAEANSAGVFIHDFATGVDRAVVRGNRQPDIGEYATFSRDGRQLAYMWNQPGAGPMEIRIASADPAEAGKSRLLFANEQVGWIEPHDWTPDGRFVSVYLERGSLNQSQLGLLSVSDGSLKILKTVAWDRLYAQGMEMCISPDGRYLVYDIRGTERRHHDIYAIPLDGSPEIPIVTHPNDDEVLGFSPDGTRILFVSDRTGSRDLWSIDFTNGKPGKESLVRSQLGQFSRLGMTKAGTIFYSLKNAGDLPLIKVASVDFATGRVLSPARDLAPDFVGRNRNPLVAPDGTKVAYISDRVGLGGDLVVVTRSVSNPADVREARPPLRELNDIMGWWPDSGSVVIVGIDSRDRRGVFRVNVNTGESTFLFEGTGFLGVSPDGSRLYFDRVLGPNTANVNESLVIERDIATGRDRELHRIQSGGRQRLVISPDGRTLYFRRPIPVGQPNDLVARDLASGEEKLLVSQQRLGQLQLAPGGQSILTLSQGKVLVISTNGAPTREFSERYSAVQWLTAQTFFGVTSAAPSPGTTNATGTEYWIVPVDGTQRKKIDLGLGTAVTSAANASAAGNSIIFLQRERATPVPADVWIFDLFPGGRK